MSAGTSFVERRFHAQDDLDLYYRDYNPESRERAAVLCLTGLTRNSKDFHRLASRLGAGRRVLCPDYRGRGRSAYDPNWRSYAPPAYVADVMALLAAANVHRVVIIGTSLGGLVAMGLGAALPTALAGVVLNDVGPEIAEEGRIRIAGYVGRDVRFPDYATAGQALKAQFSRAYPDLSDERWTDYARNTFTEDSAAGNLRLDYDLKLGDALREQAAQPLPDLWPLYRGLANIPTLVVRGALSDVLSQATFDRMAQEKPDLVRVSVPNRGHVPLLDETESQAALDDFLARC